MELRILEPRVTAMTAGNCLRITVIVMSVFSSSRNVLMFTIGTVCPRKLEEVDVSSVKSLKCVQGTSGEKASTPDGLLLKTVTGNQQDQLTSPTRLGQAY